MPQHGLLRRSLLTLPIVVLLLLTCATGAALAADNSNDSMLQYDRDNCSQGFSTTYPHHCWQGFDMIYYKEQVWEAWYKGGVGTPDEYDKIAVYIAQQPVGKDAEGKDIAPISEPPHYTVPDSDIWSGDLTHKRHSVARFAVFKDRLFIYYARIYTNGRMTLWEKELDDTTFDGKSWQLDGQDLWSESGVLQGMVVKVVNDTIYILGQKAGSRDLYLMTSTDAETYTAREKVYTFTGNDCILNGDIVAAADGSPRITFVTKDDVTGGSHSTGTCKLFSFDPETKTVTALATFPNKYKDVAMVAGNVKDCTAGNGPAYDANSLQIWGIGWGTQNVYHMQYRFNDDVTAGSFEPAGIVDCGNTSSRVTQEYRGYLAACAAPEQVAEETPDGTTVESLQMTARVWWWGSTDVSKAHGRSRKYHSDYLKNLGPQESSTDQDEISDAWILQGVVMGVPPYYPNATEVGKLNGNCLFEYGIEDSTQVKSTVTSKKTFGMSYKKEGLFKLIPSSSVGFSYSNAVEQTTSDTKTTTLSQTLKFGPDNFPDLLPNELGIKPGAEAWGIFLAPSITSDEYQLYAPDRSTDLDITLYYTYISAEDATLKAKVFDMTDPTNPYMTEHEQEYWAGMKRIYPNSKEYWDPRWKGSETAIAEGGTADYDTVFHPGVDVSMSWDTWELAQSDTDVESEAATNTLNISGGAFGFQTNMEGQLTLSSTTSTTFGKHVCVAYGINGWSNSQVDPLPVDYPYYLTKMNFTMYLLRARTENAFWIPDGAKGMARSFPWCVTWHVNSYHNKSMDILQDLQSEVVASPPALPTGVQRSLVVKLKTAQAAYEAGRYRAVSGLVKALTNQLRAQSGKAVPTDLADSWISLLESLRATLP